MIKIIVYMTLGFLLGGIAAVTYFTLTADNNLDKKNNKKNEFYVTRADKQKFYSMQEIDSLTAASNRRFTSMNAVEYTLIDTTAFRKM